MNEQPTLRAIEKKVEEEFHLKKFIVVADAGLNGWENKVYNNMSRNRAYIVTQPIKKLNESLREWVTNPKEWQIEGVKKKFDLENIVAEAEEKNIDIRDFKIEINGKMAEVYNLMFYKERWDIKSKKSTITNNK
ncbi:hypothetical protein [Enterococcus cecorum]|nr:hypothetical protein [Enterococcus cecorum]